MKWTTSPITSIVEQRNSIRHPKLTHWVSQNLLKFWRGCRPELAFLGEMPTSTWSPRSLTISRSTPEADPDPGPDPNLRSSVPASGHIVGKGGTPWAKGAKLLWNRLSPFVGENAQKKGTEGLRIYLKIGNETRGPLLLWWSLVWLPLFLFHSRALITFPSKCSECKITQKPLAGVLSK